MQPSRALLVICAVLVGAACDDNTPTNLGGFPELPAMNGSDLDVRAPNPTREMFVQYVSDDRPASGDALGSRAPRAGEWNDLLISLAQTVVSARGRISTLARQQYTGTQGRIETTLTVRHGLDRIGEQEFVRESGLVFPIGFSQWLVLQGEVPMYQTCGLTAEAATEHTASLAVPTPQGLVQVVKSVRTSSSGLQKQDPCEERIEGQAAGPTDDEEELMCYFRVWFDRETGVVVKREFLGCSGGSGGLN